MKNKHDIRQSVNDYLSSIPLEEHHIRSMAVSDKLIHMNLTGPICCYYPTASEVDIKPIFDRYCEQGLYFPKYNQRNQTYYFAKTKELKFKTGFYGIPEPVSNDVIDLDTAQVTIFHWIIPGLAFSKKGERIGKGSGHYDRFLKQSIGQKIGICFTKQIFNTIPQDVHDEIIDVIVCETGIITVN